MEQVLETVRESLEAQGLPRSATDDFAFFPTEEGVVLVHLGFNDAVTPEVVEVVVADVNYATGAIDNDNFKSDTFYHENNWRKDSSGGAFRKALETKTGKSRFRDLQKRLDGRLLQTLKESTKSTESLQKEQTPKDTTRIPTRFKTAQGCKRPRGQSSYEGQPL